MEKAAAFYREVVGLIPCTPASDAWAWFWAGEPGAPQRLALHRGSLLAQSVVSNLAGWNKVSARGVKQAGFVVLKSPRIPSILVETAFITNPAENRLLASGTFQREMARRLANGVVAYFTNVSVAEARP